MASTKTSTSLLASTANTAGSTTNSTVRTATTDYGSAVWGTMVNGGTGPTLPCVANLQVSNDNTTFYTVNSATAGVTASTTYPFSFTVGPEYQYFRVSFSGNTVQTVTCLALASSLTGL